MKTTLTCLAVGLAALAAAAEPALSGDWNHGAGSYKDRGYGGVPVPAPAPIPEYKGEWYVRGDVGYTVGSSGRITSEGVDVGAYTNFSQADGPLFGSIGVGRDITPTLRGEVTFDFRPDQRIGKKAKRTYQIETHEEGPGINEVSPTDPDVILARPSATVHNYDVERTEDLRVGNHTFMFNLYQDIKTGSAVTPYIGAGLGLAVANTKRRFSEDGQCTGSYELFTSGFAPYEERRFNLPRCTAEVQTYTNKDGVVETSYGLAASLMTGAAFQVSDGTAIDIGYRFLWQGTGVHAKAQSGPDGESSVRWDHRIDHEIRTGVRFDIN